jgi:3-hydroxybutyryl-CoA dehydrogenase
MTIQNVLIVGAGTMGAGIAQLCAQAGLNSILADATKELADKGKARIEKGLADRVEKGKMTAEEKQALLGRIRTEGSLSAAKDADIVIESVSEDLAIKKKVFAELEQYAGPEVLFLTNTTSLSITAIAEATKRPDKFVQMHFFNPPVIMKLVEIMPGKNTSPKTIEAVNEFALKLGKDPVICKTEAPAGIVSRVLGQLLNEATWLVASGVADPADVDKAMKLGANHPMGPLQLIDLIGLDVHKAKMQTLRRELNDPRYEHPKLIDEMITQNKLGKKSGRGFYEYGS